MSVTIVACSILISSAIIGICNVTELSMMSRKSPIVIVIKYADSIIILVYYVYPTIIFVQYYICRFCKLVTLPDDEPNLKSNVNSAYADWYRYYTKCYYNAVNYFTLQLRYIFCLNLLNRIVNFVVYLINFALQCLMTI